MLASLLPVLLLAVSFLLHACGTARALRAEAARGPRDPATGILIGCEPLVLNPPAAADRNEAVLLIHGFVGARGEFAGLGEQLAADGCTVRLMRLPGHGTTPQDFARRSPDELYAAVESEYHALRARFPRVSVAGFSMGGALATLLAARESRAGRRPPDRLILCAPFYRVTWRWFYVLPAETWYALAGRAVPWVLKSDRFVQVSRRESVPHIFTYHVVPSRGLATLFALGRAAADPAVAGAIRCPVLLLMSENDRAASPHHARRVFEALASPCKRAEWLPRRNNHQIFWDYDADRAVDAVRDFLRESPAGRPDAAALHAAFPAMPVTLRLPPG